MKLLAIDYGAKRLGLALTDDAQTLAFAHGTHHRKPNDNRGDIAAVLALIRAQEVGGIVMGAPSGSQGSDQTDAAAQRFAARLDEAARAAGLQLEWHRADERYSSALAARGLRASGVSARRAREDGLLDSGAACALLQTLLDARQTTPSPTEAERPPTDLS